jgi:hypothetical protein
MWGSNYFSPCGFLTGTKNPVSVDGISSKLSDQGSNLDFPESKSGVLPVTPSDKVPIAKTG